MPGRVTAFFSSKTSLKKKRKTILEKLVVSAWEALFDKLGTPENPWLKTSGKDEANGPKVTKLRLKEKMKNFRLLESSGSCCDLA